MVYRAFLNKQGAKLILKKPLSLHLSKNLKKYTQMDIILNTYIITFNFLTRFHIILKLIFLRAL